MNVPGTRLDRLSADERALLELVLKQGFDYDELTSLLGIDRETVRRRALSACDALVGPDTPAPPDEQRAEIVDYLLGQQSPHRESETQEHLALSDEAQAWALAASNHLRALSETAAERVQTAEEEAGGWDLEPAQDERAWRAPDMVVPFAIYVLIILAGLSYFIVIGLEHR